MKELIIDELLRIISLDLASAKESAQSTKSLANSEEFKAESKWDTRGIEAGYLAGAQERRIKEIELEILSLNNLKDNLFTRESIGIGSLVVTDKINYFITPLTGGLKLELNNKLIQIVSLSSPIALKLINDEIEYVSFV
jgi:hypothetical protein